MQNREPIPVLEVLFRVEQCGGWGCAQVLTTTDYHGCNVAWFTWEDSLAGMVIHNSANWPVFDVRRNPDA